MKISKEVLQRIIAEEKSAMLEEATVLKMKEGRGSWKAQQRKAFHAANDEYLKTHDKEWWDAHEKRAKEDEYKPDPHSKYEREKASDDMAKPDKKNESLGEGKLTREFLQSIIKEEYSMLMKEYEAWMVGDDGYLRDDEGNEVYVGGPAREWNGPWPKGRGGQELHGRGSSSYGGSKFPSETPENIAKLEAALARQPNNDFLKSVVAQVKSGKSLSPKQKAVPSIARILSAVPAAAKPAAPAAPAAAPSAGGSPLAAKAQALVAQKPELASSSTIKAIMAGQVPNKFALAAFEKKYGVKLS